MEFLKDKKIIIILIFFLVLKLGFVFLKGNPSLESVTGDATTYYNFAVSLLGNPITFVDFNGHYRPPGYPFVLAIFFGIFGKENLIPIYIFQALLSLGTAFFIYKIVQKIFNVSAFLSFAWAGLYPSYFLFSTQILGEEIVVFFMVLTFFFLLKLFEETAVSKILKSENFWVFIFSYSFLIHTDPRYFFYLPFLALLFFVFQRKHFLKNYSLTVVIFALTLVPWTVRNYFAYGGFVLVNTRTFDGTGRESVDRFKSLTRGTPFNGENVLVNKKYPTEEERLLIKSGQNPNNRLSTEVQAILDDKYPTNSNLEKRWINFLDLWRFFKIDSSYRAFNDCRFEPAWSLGHNLVATISFGLLIPFMFFGIYDLARQRNKWVIFLVTPIILQTVLHILMWGKERYRLPIDAFVIILGCYGITVVSQKFQLKGLFWQKK